MMTYQDTIRNDLYKAQLDIFDMDETLFNTFSRIRVREPSGIVRELSNTEFNHYELKEGETFDFSDFRCAFKFERTSLPINPVIDRLMRRLKNIRKSRLDRAIILTARADFNAKEPVIRKFAQHGIDIDNEVFVERAGNIGGPTVENKKQVVRAYLDTMIYKKVVMYDDSEKNLDGFLELKEEYSNIKFAAHHVDGWNIRRYE